ncbi:VWA domain-containing protein [Pelotomaculum isophthalicicum JI]|uniref:VWA domain-containing protein n=1 Tax=Pelotomaculum isophthalicicum JI TaxID=947010 RepID=A0A9X4GXK7_9FIRM|nr:VWA domain-containing protein [Pelotomaculum isophthalicicum]MDF9406890.1 VWA domain-containing protein [Pelotomaculum isophthalicicum JI]
MFVNFFYELKRTGVPVSLTEWMTLMEALSKGLAFSSLSGFYYLARAVLVKSEAHFDSYDIAFQNYFKGIETPADVLEQAMEWLKDALPPYLISPEDRKLFQEWDLDKLRRELDERLKTQDGQHHGGSKWIGTGGRSPFGHGGYNPAGVRIGGESTNRSAVKVAAERRYRGYRGDETLGVRQFEVALRKLRQLTSRTDGEKDVLDLDGTIDATCRNAGRLELVWDRSRKNTMKVVVVMDSGGSMDEYIDLCSQLFSAVNRSTHFKDLKFYYFHNCIYENIYVNPSCVSRYAVKTYDFLRDLDPEYRLIIVGDASMSPSELTMVGGALDWDSMNNEPGLVWLERLIKRFPHAVWLNPVPYQWWDPRLNYGAHSIVLIRKLFPMFELTLDGLEQAIKSLKVKF